MKLSPVGDNVTAATEEPMRIPAFIAWCAMILPFLAMPAMMMKILAMSRRGQPLKFNFLGILYWIFGSTVPVMLFMLAYMSYFQPESSKDTPMAPVIVLALGVLAILGVYGSRGKNAPGPKWESIANTVLGLYSLIVYHAIWATMVNNPKTKIALDGPWGDIIGNTVAAILLFFMIYLPTRYLFLREEFGEKHTRRHKWFFWLSFVASIGIEISGIYK